VIIRKVEQLQVWFGDSLPDVEAWLQSAPRIWRQNSSRTNSARHDWDLGAGWDGALRMAKTGWEEGVRKIDVAARQIVPTARTASFSYDVAGEFPDVSRFCAGDPMHMRSRKHDKAHRPVVHLVVNVCCSGSVAAQHFVNYGAAVAGLVDQLENAGRRVELDVIGVNGHNGRGRTVCGWKVKRAEDHLDLSAVAYSIAHPAAFRRLMFAMWERTPLSLECSGYGSVQKVTEQDAEAIGAVGALILDGVGESANGVSVEELNRRMRVNVQKAFGIEIGED
jgi:hypothetical protein